MSLTDLQKNEIIAKRQAGQNIRAIGTDLGIPWQTVWSVLYRGGLANRKQGAPRAAQPASPADGESSVPVAVVNAPVATGKTSDGFVPPKWYPVLRYAMAAEKGATLFGPRGCGKSTAIRELATEIGHPTVTMQCAANMQIDALLGTWTSKKGSLRFIDGPLTIALRTGSWLIAEESNVIHPGVWSLVNTLTDQTGEGLRLPTGEVIPPHKGFRLILIYNEGYTGTREVNAALKDRLMPIYADYLEPKQEAKLLEIMTGCSPEEASQVQSVAKMIRSADLHFDLSPRSLTRWIRLVKQAGMTWQDAYDVAILDLVGPPQLAAPQRACLTEIARNSVAQWPNAAPAAAN